MSKPNQDTSPSHCPPAPHVCTIPAEIREAVERLIRAENDYHDANHLSAVFVDCMYGFCAEAAHVRRLLGESR